AAARGSVVVTAQKRAESVQEVPASITAIGGEELRRDELRTANDAIRYVPNAQASITEGRARPRWFIRGVGINDPATNVVSPIGVYADEVYQGNSLLQAFPLFDLERVEVLRGPQGTLWGKNTTGGALSFVSKKPAFTADGYVKASIGSHQERLLEGAYGGPVSDTTAVRFAALNYDRDGIATAPDGSKLGKQADNAARFQVLTLLNENLDLLLNVHGRNNHGQRSPWYLDYAGTTPTGPLQWAGNNTRGNVGYNYDQDDVKSDGVSATLNWNSGGYTLTSITAVETGERETAGDGDYTPINISLTHARVKTRQISQELRLASPKQDRWNWIAGVYFFKENLGSDSSNAQLAAASISAANPGFYNTHFDQETRSVATFFNTSYAINERWNAGGGLRWTQERKEIDLTGVRSTSGVASFLTPANWWSTASVANPLSQFARQQDTRKWNDLSYDLVTDYDIGGNQRVYARHSKGFRSGNFQGSVSPTLAPNSVNPETLKAYEAGYKSELLDKRVTFNVAAFYYDYENPQVLINQANPLPTILTNARSGTVKGVEVELRAAVTRQLTLQGALGLLRTEYQGLVQNGIDRSGNEFTRSPHVSFDIGAEYRIPLANGAAVKLGTDWHYKGEFFFNALNQTTPALQQKAYWLGNARIAYALADKKTEFFIAARNITDRGYKTVEIAPSNGSYKYTLGEPRIVTVGVSTKF
ncbi:TonB-dependent receptor, partial [Noviherbaspirillum denitrificans]